ncbi:PREDICTED: lysM domain receptor [Prunus dulcis]|uniref:PREDICTED: lysM domain receptor n=1 Tax=Prunus dulcis TaxID=3755 RepID=A0A5E4F583_PRUDU|nr:protein LYK5 [Prunus dulcis]VVA23143.1 PREDICTED: lysM domain receptor [Prunus dulcis]
MNWMVLVVVVVVVFILIEVQGQQSYVDNKQLDCYNHYNTTDGYVCNGVASSCLSYLTFRSIPPYYNSPTSIAYLLGSEPTRIAAANNISDVQPISADTLILVPVDCSCSPSSYYQHNASYVLKSSGETYFRVANNTYQGLTTCQALMAQNPFPATNLTVGLTLQVPLRCACPTANQTAAGVKFLLSYLVASGDDPPSIAQRFGLDLPTLLQANRLSSNDTIYPFTQLLLPLTSKPTPAQLQQRSSSPPSPPPSAAPPPNSNNNSKINKPIFVGVGVGAACLLLLVIMVFLLLHRRRRQHYQSAAATESPNSKLQVASGPGIEPGKIADYLPTSPLPSSDTISSRGLGYAVESLTLYELEQLQRATQFFSEANRIQGSVFRGSFEGDDAAIKVVIGDVSQSGDEINLLKRINHSNIIRLSGFCVHQGHTYLVYEYAPSGSLSHCLHSPTTLSWKQRVQIAHDVADALNYLHNFTHPPCIHNNLKTSNILLDASLRAKLSNFGLARPLLVSHGRNHNQDQLQLTRHVVGTHGYMPPEYIQNGVITPKLDVFAFGVVLLELLSGREAAAAAAPAPASNNGGSGDDQELLLSASISGVLEGDHVRDKLEGFMDPSLKREYPLDLAFSMAQLAKSCVATQINSRPTMAEAFITLSKILSSTLDWDPSDADELQHSTTSLSLGR